MGHNGLTRDGAPFVGGQEYAGIGQFVLLGRPFQGVVGHLPGKGVLYAGSGCLGPGVHDPHEPFAPHRCCAEAVYPDAVFSHFLGKRLGEADDTHLCATVCSPRRDSPIFRLLTFRLLHRG